MRGKVWENIKSVFTGRITPAYAGKSGNFHLMRAKPQDHPRLCGEKATHGTGFLRALGSPPPMRGKGLLCTSCVGGFGITPAYAGKRIYVGRFVRRMQDHPRLCGEKHSTFVIRSRRLGSPPPMRGKVSAISWAYKSGGITPAYAGKSQRLSPTASSHEDHPRLCGEKIQAREAAGLPAGSPPPMRGKAVCVPK